MLDAPAKQESREENFTVPAKDGFVIHGVINHAPTPATKAVVLCHGLTGHINEHHLRLAKRFFNARGYDVIRFAFYHAGEGARRIQDSDVSIHAADLHAVLDHFAPQYGKIFVAGHSYGGLTVLTANPAQVVASSLWDATFRADIGERIFSTAKYIDDLAGYVRCLGAVFQFMGTAIVDEARAFTDAQFTGMANALQKPAQVIAAGLEVENLPYQKNLFAQLGCEKEYVELPTDHCFYKGDTVFDLLDNTYRWFEKF